MNSKTKFIMKHKKTILVSALTLALTACGGSDGTSSQEKSDSTVKTAAKVTILKALDFKGL